MNRSLLATCILALSLASTPLAAQSYGGWIDSVGCSGVTGWAWNSAIPNTPVNVDLYDSTTPIGTVTANIYRADLYAGGYGNGYHGFSFTVPPNLMDGKTHFIYAFMSGGVTAELYGGGDFNCAPGSTGYQYYYTDPFASVSSSYWTQNGTVNASSSGLTASSTNGGSLISSVAVPDGTSDYEVLTTLNPTASGGTFVTYLRASSNAMSGPAATGTFYSVEMTPTVSSGICSAAFAIKKTVAGSVTTLVSSTHPCFAGMTVRSDIIGSYIGLSINNLLWLYASDSSITSGKPGVGAFGTPAGNSIQGVSLGGADRVAPGTISSQQVTTFVLPTEVDIKFPGVADDSNGSGVALYQLYRGSTWIGSSDQPEFSDTTVTASTSYTYQIYALDYFNNWSSAISVGVNTPGSSSVDTRRLGSRPTGAYWGASPEQIDVLSGNLNFSIPLLSAQGRNGWSVPFNLSYNSQNWRHDLGGTWELGSDVGYGYGWRLMAGSLTAYYVNWLGVAYYQFIDSTGAEYRLDQNSGGVWSSLQSIYLWYDSNTNILHFRDGSFWVMGCTSGGTEPDAGTMYPTTIEDSNGNQILVRYYAGLNLPWTNSSARIQEIEDVRATIGTNEYKTYNFLFTAGASPHLTNIQNTIQTSEGYTFGFTTQEHKDPFFAATFPGPLNSLTNITISGIGAQYNFTYDNSGEMTKAILPYLGYIKWNYGSMTYSSGITQQEVQSRVLSKDGTAGSETTYSFFHESYPATIHQCTILDDPGQVGEKYWGFNTSGTYIGLVNVYQGRQVAGAVTHSGCSSESPSPTVLTESDFTWSQSAGNSYISSTLVTANSVQSMTTQTVDGYGNVMQAVKYNYGDLTHPYRTYNYSYLNSSSYLARYIYNRVTSATVTDSGGTTTPLVGICYDSGGGGSCTGTLTAVSPTPREWDAAVGSVNYRGNPTTIVDPSNGTSISRNITGAPVQVTVNGITTSVSTSTTTNYAAPEQLTVGSLYTRNTYNAFLGLTNEVDQNSSGISLGYDSYARPTSSTSPFGATIGTTYHDTALPPYIYTASSARGGWTNTILDGLGRTREVDTADSTGTLSVAESVYGSCGCSPLGKLMRQAVPHALGATPAYTTYSYDGIGRTVSVQAPDGASTTSYFYSGNQITVIDPVGNWKIFAMDVAGNLVAVTEPNPAGGSYSTSYTYDGLNHLTNVWMTRGSTTQTRSFTYNGNYLTSATNPENGRVTYTYNGYGKVATRVDAMNQKVVYTYDSYARLMEVQRYLATGPEDTCQQEDYYYDSNTLDTGGSGYSNYTAGRLAAVQYWGGNTGSSCTTTFQEWYNYGTPPAPIGKKLRATRSLTLVAPPYSQLMNVDLNGTFVYDTEGKMTSESYPTDNAGATASLTMSYDSMGRLYTLTDQTSTPIIASATYGPANELTQMTGGTYYGAWGTETRTYNAMKQLTQLISAPYSSGSSVSLQYNYSATQNNGKITSQYDALSGETVTYTYDSLNRLLSAAATSGGTWSQGYTYDGFGNLTAITGTAAASYSYNPATNQGPGADGNGNSMAASSLGTSYGYTYDIENRIVITPAFDPGGTTFYSYAPGNKRVWRGNGGTVDELTFWSPSGQKLGTYALTTTAGTSYSGPQFYATQTGTNYYFGDKMIKNASGWVRSDRLGSIGKFYPYGQERPSATANGTEKFTGYVRDAETGNDYADQRYASPGTGRFLTADRYAASSAGDPGSWNLYAYTRGDPVNRIDLHGMNDTESDGCSPGFVWDPGRGYCEPEPTYPIGIVGGSGPGTGSGETGQPTGPAVPKNLPSCAKNINLEQNALNDIIMGFSKALTAAGVSWQEAFAITDRLASEESNPNDVTFVGGHFNLTLAQNDINDLNAGADLANLFTMFPAAIGRGSRYDDIGLGNGTNLHINQNSIANGGGYTFHIDLTNPQDVLTVVKHLGQEIIGGHWPFNNCLDPAFQN